MLLMLLPNLSISLSQFPVLDYKEILRIILLDSLCEVVFGLLLKRIRTDVDAFNPSGIIGNDWEETKNARRIL